MQASGSRSSRHADRQAGSVTAAAAGRDEEGRQAAAGELGRSGVPPSSITAAGTHCPACRVPTPAPATLLLHLLTLLLLLLPGLQATRGRPHRVPDDPPGQDRGLWGARQPGGAVAGRWRGVRPALWQAAPPATLLHAACLAATSISCARCSTPAFLPACVPACLCNAADWLPPLLPAWATPACCSMQYYPLEISFFKSGLDSHLLDLLWNKYWWGLLLAADACLHTPPPLDHAHQATLPPPHPLTPTCCSALRCASFSACLPGPRLPSSPPGSTP